jgi:VWFA-related protein
MVVAVDIESIRTGEGRIAMENLADYFDTLPSSDRIGFVELPTGSRRIAPTTDRAAIRSALNKTFGRSGQIRSCEPTLGEAAAHSVGDDRGVEAYCERAVLGLGCFIDRPPWPQARRRLDAALPGYREQTRRVLQVLTEVASSLVVLPGRRAIAFVSEGLFGDAETRRDLALLSEALERARVVLFGVHLDFPFVEASSRAGRSNTRLLDDRYGFDAMSEAAVAGGGEAIRAISRATPAIRRIDHALSGFYVLAFERGEIDQDGKRLSLKVETSRKGADVRARTQVTINPGK